ncbi:ATPase family AAA domain-containing protein At1g05910 [Folsomia candida]|nr:ATPase family AAA domain-containing protein At1g05910 [Folsomia candida]
MWFGESEENLRKLFNKAKANVPSIIFFDELDALCPNRDKASESSEAYVGVVTELLALIDSVKRGDVLIIGATNRLDAIDVAIRRPGRFDKDLAFNLPDIPGRKKIVQIHTQKWFRDQPDSEQLETIANNTIGYSGADLQKLCTDTFIAAKDRCGRVPAAEITISSADWAKAMKEMRPSKSDVFESTLIAAKPPLPLMMPLAGNMIKEIVTSLGDILPRDNGHFPFAMTGMRSYLVREGNLDSEVFLNHVILTGVLSDPTVSNVPVYYLDLPHLAGRIDDGLTAIKAARCIIKQAENSDRPCILFVPGINWINDAIAQHTREQNDFVFFDLLRTLAGTNAILLASVIGNMKEISAEILTPFSDRNVYKVRVPEREERLAFYRQIFDDLIPTEDDEPREKRAREESRDDVDRFEKHLQTAVDLTENDPCDFLLKLYEKLRKVKIEHYVLDENQGNLRYDLDGLDRSFTEIFDLYHLNRLQE